MLIFNSVEAMSFKQLFDPETSTLTYILMDPVSKQAVMIDPVLGQEERDLAELDAMGATLTYIAETHVHADHITGARIIKEMTNCQFISGEGTGVSCADKLMGDGHSVSFGEETLYAIKTPGHTSGCTTYRWRDRLFTGDTLLIGGCGRTDCRGPIDATERTRSLCTSRYFTHAVDPQHECRCVGLLCGP